MTWTASGELSGTSSRCARATRPTRVMGVRTMPGATWFPGTTVNYAEHVLRCPGRGEDDVVVLGRSQTQDDNDLTLGELRALVGSLQQGLTRLGVDRGDRVVAYLPTIPEALALMLACAGLGVVFSSCPPEFGSRAVLDRWTQIEPLVLVTVDGYRYGSKRIDRRAEVAEIVAGLPSLRHVVGLPYLKEDQPVHHDALAWSQLSSSAANPTYAPVAFDEPLWVLFSSGTTGPPKAIVHGHGGITLEHLKTLGLQIDLGPDSCFFWFTTTGWMMWNFLVSGLAMGSTVVLFDGNPGYPDIGATWRVAEATGVTTSAPALRSSSSVRGKGNPWSRWLTWRRSSGSARLELPCCRRRSTGSMNSWTHVCTSRRCPEEQMSAPLSSAVRGVCR